MMFSKEAWRRLLTLLIVAAAFGFLGHTAYTNWRELNRHEWRIDGLLLAASLAAHVAVLAWGVWVWSRVLGNFAAPRIEYPQLLRVWSLSNAARYIPGAIWQFLAAAQLSRERGLPGVLALTSMLLHVGFSLLAAMLVAAFTLPLDLLLGLGPGTVWALRALMLLSVVLAIQPRVLNGLLRLVPKALHREVLLWKGSWGSGLLLLILSCFSWVIYGIAYFLFIRSLTPVPIAAWIPYTGVNALSFVAGYVAVLAPGGIGVREAAMTLLLSPSLPSGVAAVVSIAARLWSVAAELVLVGTGILLGGRPAGIPASGSRR